MTPEKAKVTLSVIVPVCNRARLLGETLHALLAQTRPADEIIVVDDGSTDGSGDVARTFGEPVRVIRIENAGPARARNTGLAQARGSFVQFMDSDDLPTPRFLESRLELLASAGVDMVYGPWTPAWIDGGVVTLDGFVRQARPVASPLNSFLRGWVLFLPNTMVRRSLLEEVGGYPEDLLTGEDMLLLFRLLRRTSRLAHTDASVLLVRQHPSSQLSAAPDLALRRLRDEAALTRVVAEDLAREDLAAVTPSALAVKQWRARTQRAQSAADQLDLPDREQNRSSRWRTDICHLSTSISRRLKMRIRYQFTGHRIDPAYEPVPLSAAFRDEIETLGLGIKIVRTGDPPARPVIIETQMPETEKVRHPGTRKG